MTSHNHETQGESAGEQGGPRDLRQMSVSEALQKIHAGQTISNVRIVGLRLSGKFTGGIKMDNVTLVRPRFSGATFCEPVGLYRCTLIRPLIGQKTVFESVLNLGGSTIKKGTFQNCEFRGSLRCDDCRFVDLFRIQKAKFESGIRLWNARFEGWVEFRECQFEQLADFRSFHAEEGIQIQRCQFSCDFLMRGSTVAKKLDFGSSRFEKLLDLSKAKLHDFVYLERIQQGTAQRFALANMIADRILIGTDQIDGRLVSEENGEYAEAMREFGIVKRNFETLNRHQEEDWAFYRFKINQRRSRPSSWLRPWTKLMRLGELVFLDWGCGYGTDPFRAVRTAVVMILLFAAIYMVGIDSFNVSNAPLPNEPLASLANRSLYGLMTSISVFTAGFTGEHLNSAQGWMLLPLGLEALLGTLLWGLFIVAFSRKVIR